MLWPTTQWYDTSSEAQRCLGFPEFFNKLPEDAKTWWNENLVIFNWKRRRSTEISSLSQVKAKKRTSERKGKSPRVKTLELHLTMSQVQRSLRLITVATLGAEQGKGYGSALLKEIMHTVSRDTTTFSCVRFSLIFSSGRYTSLCKRQHRY